MECVFVILYLLERVDLYIIIIMMYVPVQYLVPEYQVLVRVYRTVYRIQNQILSYLPLQPVSSKKEGLEREHVQ